MGLRKPSGWQTFTAQAYAGAGQQKKAREELKDPNKTKQALGGMGSAGTSMVAATTGAQQAATKQMQETTTQASKDLKVDPSKIGTATVSAIGGTASPQKDEKGKEVKDESGATKNVYTGGMSATAIDTSVDSGRLENLASEGSVGGIDAHVSIINTNIDNITKQIEELDDKLQTASAQDAQKIQAEKDRLTEQLDVYRKKLSEENLGKIADQSTFETEMEKRERTLAEKGDNVGKLAALFGRRGVGDKALASQIYGKDLENIQKAAAQGLISKEQAEQAAAEAETQYSKQLDESKKGYEKTFETEDRKLELLKMSPEELKGVTKKEVDELFGPEMAERLFDFKDDYISDSQSSATRKILSDNLQKQKDLKTKASTERDKAIVRRDEIVLENADKILGTVDKPGELDGFDQRTIESQTAAQKLIQHIKDIKNSWTATEWSGISKDSWHAEEANKIGEETKAQQEKYRQEMIKAKDDKDLTKLKQLRDEYKRYTEEQDMKMWRMLSNISNDAYYDSGTSLPQRVVRRSAPVTATDANRSK